MLHDDLAEDFARLDALQADIGAHGRAHVTMAENSSDQFVFARSAHENESTSGMPELMYRHPQSRCLKNALGDLVT